MKKFALILSAVLLLAQAAPVPGNENTAPSGGIAAAADAVAAAENALTSDTWTCPECGTTGLTNAFCSECGSARPQENTAGFEGDGFSAPEEAVSAYIEAMNAGDVNAMAATFAIETYVDHLDARASMERMRSFVMPNYSSVPAIGPLSRSLLVEQRRNEITGPIYNSYLFYATAGTDYESIGNGSPETLSGEDSIDSLLSVLEAAQPESWVGHISITKVCAPDDPLVSSYMPDASKIEQGSVNIQKQLEICGGDEYTELIAVLDVNGSTGAQFMQCIRYGDKWYNWRAFGLIPNLLGLTYMTNGLVVGIPAAGE